MLATVIAAVVFQPALEEFQPVQTWRGVYRTDRHKSAATTHVDGARVCTGASALGCWDGAAPLVPEGASIVAAIASVHTALGVRRVLMSAREDGGRSILYFAQEPAAALRQSRLNTVKAVVLLLAFVLLAVFTVSNALRKKA